MEYTTVSSLAKDVKFNIDEYNSAEQSKKKEAHERLQRYVQEILSSPKNRSLIYKGDDMAVVFSKTLGKWRMKIWEDVATKS